MSNVNGSIVLNQTVSTPSINATHRFNTSTTSGARATESDNYDNIALFVIVWTASLVVAIIFAAVTGYWYHHGNQKRAERAGPEPIKKIPSSRSLEQNCQSTETL